MDRAVGLAADLLDELEDRAEALTLIPGSGGIFDVTVNGTLVYSKHRTGRFPEKGEVQKLIA